jgi:hypothetical protein
MSTKTNTNATASSTEVWPPKDRAIVGTVKNVENDSLILVSPDFRKANPRSPSSGAFKRFEALQAAHGKTWGQFVEDWQKRAKDKAQSEYFGGRFTPKAEFNYSAAPNEKRGRPAGYVCLQRAAS